MYTDELQLFIALEIWKASDKERPCQQTLLVFENFKKNSLATVSFSDFPAAPNHTIIVTYEEITIKYRLNDMVLQFLTDSSIPGKFSSPWVSKRHLALYWWLKIINFVNCLRMLGPLIFAVACFAAWCNLIFT